MKVFLNCMTSHMLFILECPHSTSFLRAFNFIHHFQIFALFSLKTFQHLVKAFSLSAFLPQQ